MANLIWEFTLPLVDEKAVKKFEIKNAYKLPEDLKRCIQENNGGMPTKNVFDTDSTKNRTIKGLLSFNESDEESVYNFLGLFKDNNELKMVPFAIDPYGNLICIEDDKIVFWNHETETTEYIAKDFSEFLSCLHE